MAIGTDSYAYDALDRLTSTSAYGNGATYSETYQYDGFGNMLQITPSGTGGRTMTYTPKTNQIQSVTGMTGNFSYDGAGNVTHDDLHSYVYDPFNMISEVDNGTTAVAYSLYDASDERIGAESVTSGQWSWSVRGPDEKVLRQFQSGPNPADPWLWTEDYVYRDGQLAGAERPAEEGGRRHFHLDHLGTPRVITNDDGQVLALHDYHPFGFEATSQSQETARGWDREEPMKFTGHERDGDGSDDATYLDYMHGRYYAPLEGRFLSVDPRLDFQQAVEHPQAWNRFTYVNNNPIGRTDPNGDSWLEFFRKANQIQLYNDKGQLVGSWSASNHPQQSPPSAAPLKAGRYSFADTSRPHSHGSQTHTRILRNPDGSAVSDSKGREVHATLRDDSSAGRYGPYGIFRLATIVDNVGTRQHDGIGVHSGSTGEYDQAGRTGWEATTLGCVRTTDDAMKTITGVASTDPLRYLEVHP